ncbi:hypothetical protein Tco_0765418 [Tanacetum coccineum]
MIVTTPVVPATEDSPAVPEQTTVETVMNMTLENRAHFESKKEAIHLLLTGIGDEIYSSADACQTTQEMWEAIERLQQASEEDSDPEQAQRDKNMQKKLALIAKYFKKIYKPTNNNLRTSSNTKNKNVDTTPRKDCWCRKQAEKGGQLKAKHLNGIAARYEDIDEQELITDDNVSANDIQHFEQSESISNTCAVETGDSNIIPDSPDMCDNDIQDS